MIILYKVYKVYKVYNDTLISAVSMISTATKHQPWVIDTSETNPTLKQGFTVLIPMMG